MKPMTWVELSKLPPVVAWAIEQEGTRWVWGGEGKEIDEPTARYIYQSFLEDKKMACPHPQPRKYFRPDNGLYQCQFCLACVDYEEGR